MEDGLSFLLSFTMSAAPWSCLLLLVAEIHRQSFVSISTTVESDGTQPSSVVMFAGNRERSSHVVNCRLRVFTGRIALNCFVEASK